MKRKEQNKIKKKRKIQKKTIKLIKQYKKEFVGMLWARLYKWRHNVHIERVQSNPSQC